MHLDQAFSCMHLISLPINAKINDTAVVFDNTHANPRVEKMMYESNHTMTTLPPHFRSYR